MTYFQIDPVYSHVCEARVDILTYSFVVEIKKPFVGTFQSCTHLFSVFFCVLSTTRWWQVWCVLLLACVRPLGIGKGPGWSPQRAQGERGREEGSDNNGGLVEKDSSAEEPSAAEITPLPPPLTPGVPRFSGRGASITPLTAAPWVGSGVFSFTCGLRGLLLKPLKALMCHN